MTTGPTLYEQQRDLNESKILLVTAPLQQSDIEASSVASSKHHHPKYKPDANGRTVLHFAALGGRANAVKLLLEHNNDPNIRDEYGDYPLHLAITHQKYDAAIELCKVSLPHGGDFIILLSKNQPPRPDPKMIRLLSMLVFYGHDINALDSNGHNALYNALNHTPIHSEFVRHLIQHGIDVNQRGKYGRTPIFQFVQNNDIKTVEMLLNGPNGGAHVNVRDDFQLTPLMLAASFGTREMADLLIRYGAEMDVTVDSKEWTMSPLTLSIMHDNHEVTRLLVAKGANLELESFGRGSTEKATIWELLMANEYPCFDVEMKDGEMVVCTGILQGIERTLRSSIFCITKVQRVADEEAFAVFEYVTRKYAQQKVKGLMMSELVQTLNVPVEVISMIVMPL